MDIRDLMTTDPVVCASDAKLREAAAAMRDRHIGDVLVRDGDGRLCGIVNGSDKVPAIAATQITFVDGVGVVGNLPVGNGQLSSSAAS